MKTSTASAPRPRSAGRRDARAVDSAIAPASQRDTRPARGGEGHPVKTQQISLRLPVELIDRLDRYVTKINEQHPGWDLTRTDAVRALLTRALEAEETERKP